jgi:hypothetical protein
MNENKNMMVQQEEDLIDTRTYICGLEASKCIRIMCVLLLVVGSITAGLFAMNQIILHQPAFECVKSQKVLSICITNDPGNRCVGTSAPAAQASAAVILPFASAITAISVYALGLLDTCIGGARSARAFQVLVLLVLLQQLAIDSLSLASEVLRLNQRRRHLDRAHEPSHIPSQFPDPPLRACSHHDKAFSASASSFPA